MRNRNRQINGRFKTPCKCSGKYTMPESLAEKQSRYVYTDRVVTDEPIYTNKVQPQQLATINGWLDDILGGQGSTITTIGVTIDTPTVLRLSAGIVIAGLLIKNLNFK